MPRCCRFALKVLLIVGLWSLEVLTGTASATPPEHNKVLLVVGGCCHDYERQKEILKQGIEARTPLLVDVVHQGGTTTDAKIELYQNPRWADGYDLVIHHECFAGVDDPAWTERILAPHRAGTPAMVIHCAMHCYRDGTDEWFKFCGVTSHGHGAGYPHEVLNAHPLHPIMRGFGPAWANPAGELYQIASVLPRTTVLATAKGREDGLAHPCVWTHEYGEKQTRVFGTTLGHHNETLADPKMLDLLSRGALWAMNRLDDAALAKPDAISETSPPQTISKEDYLADVRAPEGYTLSLFAAPPAVQYPVFVAAAPDGTVYVSVDKNGSIDREPRRGAIYRLRDLDQDGQVDEVKLFVPDVDSPRGLVWDRDRLYVMHPPHLSAFIDANQDGVAEQEHVLVRDLAFGFKDRPADHTANGLALGVDGWLYVAMGDFGFMQAEGTDGRKLQFRGGGVIRVRPDGSQLEIYSRGTRNIVEVPVDPWLNAFARDNTNDGDGWDIRLHHFSGGEHHGYPSLFKRFPQEVVPPLAEYGGGSGCGACFVDEPGLPAGDSPALYTADWGRSLIFKHHLTPQGATFAADQSEFAALTRVTDLDIDASSRMYVASWKGATFTYEGEQVGYLIQLKPKDYTVPPLPDYRVLTSEQLVDELRSASHRRRLAAQRELLARGPDDFPVEPLLKLLQSELAKPKSPGETPSATSIAAMYALVLSGNGQALESLPKEFDATKPLQPNASSLLPWIVRAISEQPNVTPQVLDPWLRPGVSPRGDLEIIRAVGRMRSAVYEPLLIMMLANPDALVGHTVVRQLSEWNASASLLDLLDQPETKKLAFTRALLALQEIYQPQVVRGLVERMESATEPETKAAYFAALARLYFREGTWNGESWGTRPDTSGPLYQPETWEASAAILEKLSQTLQSANADLQPVLLSLTEKYKLPLRGETSALVAAALVAPELIPSALDAIAQSPGTPEYALPFFAHVVAKEDLAIELRLRAAQLWLASEHGGFAKAFEACVHLDQDPAHRKAVRSALLKGQILQKHVEWLRDRDQTDRNNLQGRWAVAALWAICSPLSGASPESVAAAQQSLDALWNDPNRRTQALAGLECADCRERYPQVMAAALGGDPAAQALAQRWELQLDVPAAPLVKSIPPAELVQQVSTLTGQPGHGAGVFAKLQCARCHTVEPGENLRGPYLPNVAKTYKRVQLAEAILLPSKSLAQGFVTHQFVLVDGRTLTAFVVSESPTEIVIRDGEAREFRLRPEEIDERSETTVSVMPENLAAEISVAEFAHLLAYLESLGKD